MSGHNSPISPTYGRDDSIRQIERKARERKQAELARLRETHRLIPHQLLAQFISNTGETFKTSSGNLVEWQLLSVSSQAIK